MTYTSVAAIDLLSLAGRYTDLRRVASTRGGEYHGPCPKCGGRDRFRLQPAGGRDGRGLWSCRTCHEGWGDAIVFVEWLDNVTFKEACRMLNYDLPPMATPLPPAPPEPCNPPSEAWRDRAVRFVAESFDLLWSDTGTRARAWLAARGLTEQTIADAGLGYNGTDQWDAPALWGLPDDHKKVYLPRGIVIPWTVDGMTWRVNVRRPVSRAQIAAGEAKYLGPAGGGDSPLYNVNAIAPARAVMMVEGELDALSVQQAAGDLIACVATGSTSGGRRARWYARLAAASVVLLSFDSDGPTKGDAAAAFWADVLQGFSIRWRPLLKDPSEMLQEGAGVREWVEAGIEEGLRLTADH